MFDRIAHIEAWRADLGRINAEIDQRGIPGPGPRVGRARRRARMLAPYWEE